MFRTILLASDGSDYALRAARVASEVALNFHAKLIMVHVFEIPMTAAVGTPLPGWVMIPMAPPSEEARKAVVAHTRSMISADVEIEDVQELGSPALTILQVAEARKADLIIMGSRGIGAIGRALLGSVSDNVAHHAKCSVLIIK